MVSTGGNAGRFALALLAGVCLWVSGCAWIGKIAEKRADKAAYKIIADKQEEALGQTSRVSIQETEDPLSETVLAKADRLDRGSDPVTTPSCVISLADALAIAVANNRSYKSEREGLYSQALGLTEIRRNFEPLFDLSADASRSRSETGSAVYPDGAVIERIGSRGFSTGVSKALATGAMVTLNFSHRFVHSFTSEAGRSASNDMSVSIVQPLLRGAGSLVARESLLQGERSMIYSVRRFRRYQQQFVIDAANTYYSLLRTRDQVRNVARNHENMVRNHYQFKRSFEGGRVSMLDVDEAYQEVLRAEASLSTTQKNYERQLDSFKLFLGIPVNLSVGPDPAELDRVAEQGQLLPDMTLDEAIETALSNRLDLKTAEDSVEDARRGVKIALQNFLPSLDVGYSYSTSTGDDKDRAKLDFEDNTRNASVSLGVPFDWTPRRNSYRNSQIGQVQAERMLEDFRESLILEVRDAWRGLEESSTDYRIQKESVALAKRRVRNASITLKRGDATARDLIDAEEALLDSRNALTNALVGNTIQRMEFWNTIERLDIDEQGLWAGPEAGAPEPPAIDESTEE